MKTRIPPRLELLESRIAPAAVVQLADLTSKTGLVLQGEVVEDYAGFSVSEAGDINGDGFGDVIIGAPQNDTKGFNYGAAYVVFGGPDGGALVRNLADLDGTNGFKILSESSGVFFTGFSVSKAGDFNGDGIDDIIIGSATGSFPFGTEGAAYIVFGKTTSFGPTFDLSSLDGSNGVKIFGDTAFYANGGVVSAGKDINGDGFDDVVLGVPSASPNGSYSGTTYVVFGASGGFSSGIDLASLNGSTGFRIDGEAASDRSGVSVSARDINGDGYSDVIIGAPGHPGGASQGAYVVFGTDSFSATLQLSSLDGSNGFKLLGEVATDSFGISVSAGNDVNGDGFHDFIIGAAEADPNGASSGASYVIFGKSTFGATLAVSTLDGTNGFKLTGEGVGSYTGRSVSMIGDLNDDDFGDILIGGVDASYIVYGKSGGFDPTLSLSNLNGANGFKITPASSADQFQQVSRAGDVNGDGLADLIFGVPTSNSGALGGASYILYGFAGTPVTVASNGHKATFMDADGDIVTIKLNKGTLNDATFRMGPDGQLALIDLNETQSFQGSSLTITAKQMPGGDGIVNVGIIDAGSVNLSKVMVSGTLGQIMAGDGLGKAGLKTLTVGSLGTDGVLIDPLVSEFMGAVGKLSVKGDVLNAAVSVQGKLGKVTIGGDLFGDMSAGALLLQTISDGGRFVPRVAGGIPVGAFDAGSVKSFTVKGQMMGGSVASAGDIGKVSVGGDLNSGAVMAEGRIDVVKVFGALTGDSTADPVVIAALARAGSDRPADAVAIDQLKVSGSLENAQILLGYNKQRQGVNPDASAGKIVINGDWIASSLAAGVVDTTRDGFGQNDDLIAGDQTPRIIARIASIVIKGSAIGSADPDESFAITAQMVGKLTVGGAQVPLSKTEKDNILLDEENGNFRLVEL